MPRAVLLALVLLAAAWAGCADRGPDGEAGGDGPAATSHRPTTYRFVALSGYFSGYGEPFGACIGDEDTARWDRTTHDLWVEGLGLAEDPAFVVLHPRASVDGHECSLDPVIAASATGQVEVPLPFAGATAWTVVAESGAVRLDTEVVADGQRGRYSPESAEGEPRRWAWVAIANHGTWPLAGLHEVGAPWTTCCPPGTTAGFQYWVLEFRAELDHDPPLDPMQQPACGRPSGTFGGIDVEHDRLELVEGTASFAHAWQAAVLLDVQVKGQGCQLSFLTGHADPTFQAAGYPVSLGSANVTVAGRVVEPGGTILIPVDRSDASGRTYGDVEVRLRGPWASGHVRWVWEEGQIDHTVGFAQ